jgi:hypothetical protein
MGGTVLWRLLGDRCGLPPLGICESVLGFALIAPVHPRRPGVYHAPAEPAGNLTLPGSPGKSLLRRCGAIPLACISLGHPAEEKEPRTGFNPVYFHLNK